MRGKYLRPVIFLVLCVVGIISAVYVWSGIILLSYSTVEKDSKDFQNDTDIKCLDVSVAGLKFPMCIYEPSIDQIVSKTLIQGKYYESTLVTKAVNLLKAHTDVTFVDLGANLGTYSLPMAHSGVKVISVEAFKETARRLRKSARLGNVQKLLHIVPNAVANNRSKTFLKIGSTNKGDSVMMDEKSCKNCVLIEAITINDLIPHLRTGKAFMKADIQESEIKAFTIQSAGEFFNKIDVLMIQMEWNLYPKSYGKTEDGRRMVDRFLEFFYQRNYEVYDPKTERKLHSNWIKWPYDVMFKKRNLAIKKLYSF